MIEFEAVRIGEILGPAAALIVGSAQCLLIWRGLRQMERASRERELQIEYQNLGAERRHEDAEKNAERRHEEAEKRREEGARNAEERHEDAERRAEKRHEEAERRSQRQHEEAMTALRALIERTAAPGPPSHA